MTQGQVTSTPYPQAGRPFRVTLLALGVLIIASLNLLRLIQAVVQWDFLVSLPGFSPLYLAVSGFIWAATGFPLVWGLWLGRPWAPRATQLFSVGYVLYFWLDRVFLTDDPLIPAGSSNLFFLIGLSVVVLVLIFGIFSTPRSRAFFRRNS